MQLIGDAARSTLPFLLLTLAACGSAGPSDDEVLAGAAGMERPAPGLYRSTTMLVGVNLPGADPQEARSVQAAMEMDASQESTVCLTQEDSEEGFASVLRQMQDGDCGMESFESGTTRLRAKMACPVAGGGSSRVIMTGVGSATTSRIGLVAEQEGEHIPGGRIVMQFVVENRRISDCAAE